MRRLLACACVLAVAGCGEDPGRYVTVHTGTTGADRVVLYLGQAPCTDAGGSACQRIAPELAPGIARPLAIDNASSAWFRDDDAQLEQDVHGGTARFRIVANASDTTLQIVAVGFQGMSPVGSSVIRDVRVRAHDADVVDTTLEPTQPVTPAEEDQGAGHPDGSFLLVWNSTQPPSPSDCVLAESWSGGTATRLFVVPGDDADCDGIPTFTSPMMPNPAECNELWYDFTGSAHLQDADCATDRPIAPGQAVCELGGPACVDGLGPASNSVCTPITPAICLPGALCQSACAMRQANPPPLSSCVATAIAQSQPFARIQCSVVTQADGTPCPASTTLTDPTGGPIDASALFPTSSCTDISFAARDLLNGLQPSGELDFTGTNDAKVQIQNQAAPCTFDLDWQDGHFIATAAALALFKAPNGNTLVLPISIEPTAQCPADTGTVSDGFHCSVVVTNANGDTDSIVNCSM